MNQQSTRVVVVFHSGFGHTAAIAESVLAGAASVEGVDARLISVLDLGAPDSEHKLGPEWDALHQADAIIMGCPTYMGTVSAEFKRFMDSSSAVWMEQRWRDKIAAGFTNGGGLSGDKLATLNTLCVFAAQQSMIWVSQGIQYGEEEGINRMGSFLGMMSQSDNAPADKTPPPGDHETARRFGARVAEAATRWVLGRTHAPAQS